jgi:hypothetical protein
MRWLLERYEFGYQTVEPDVIQRGKLRESWDVIILPSDSLKRLVEGAPEGTMPPQYSAGIGAQGMIALKEFVSQGGVLIASGGSSESIVTEFALPVRNSLRSASPAEFSCPGSLLRVEVDRSDPIGWGMAPEVAACFVRSHAFEVYPRSMTARTGYWGSTTDSSGAETTSVVRYAESNLLMSGWIRGERFLEGKSAVLRSPYGQGEVVLLGFPVHFRGQSHATFKLLFNSVFLAGTLEEEPLDYYASTKSHEESE